MEERHVKTGNQRHIPFMGWVLKSMAWVGIHILKLFLTVSETALLLAGSMTKIVLLVLA